jgi:putative nucleotidyltransferase with HDIG domain
MAQHDRAFFWALVNEWTQSPHLIRHMLAVECAMRAYAKLFGEDIDFWGNVGLIHDFDYERNPDLTIEAHPVVGVRYLREQGVSEIMLRAIMAHAEYTGVKPESQLEKTLVAVDELTGFIGAVALVRPSKKLADVELKSIKKKWKEKEFAKGVHRDQIEQATAALGMPLDEHILMVLEAMQANAEALGM